MTRWEYTSWRPIAMQIVMWLLLAGTVGLAALVNQYVQRQPRVTLSEPIAGDGLILRLPRGWQLVDEPDPRIIVRLREPVSPENARLLTLYYEPTTLDSPDTYLVESGLLPRVYLGTRHLGREVHEIEMAGHEAILIAGSRRVRSLGNAVLNDVIASVVLPDGEALTFLLQGTGTYASTDVELVRQLAEALQRPN
jgi:hypothetical protein